MNQTVEIKYDVAMKIVYRLCSKFATNFLNLLNVIKAVVLKQLLLKEFSLLVKVIFLDFLHELLNLSFFVLDHIVERYLHPHEHSVSVSIFFLNPHIFFAIQEIIFLFKLRPELFTPFGQDSQDGRALDGELPLFDFFSAIGVCAFRDFSSYEVMGIVFDLLSILLVRNVVGIVCVFFFDLDSAALTLSLFENGLSSLVVHPLFIVDVFEDVGHRVEKALIDSFVRTLYFFVDVSHEPVQKLHDQVIVVA